MSEKHDIDQLLRGIEAARAQVAQYHTPGPRSAVDTLDRIIDALEDRDFVAALDRLRRRRIIRVIE